jgi:hypothetical protein
MPNAVKTSPAQHIQKLCSFDALPQLARNMFQLHTKQTLLRTAEQGGSVGMFRVRKNTRQN